MNIYFPYSLHNDCYLNLRVPIEKNKINWPPMVVLTILKSIQNIWYVWQELSGCDTIFSCLIHLFIEFIRFFHDILFCFFFSPIRFYDKSFVNRFTFWLLHRHCLACHTCHEERMGRWRSVIRKAIRRFVFSPFELIGPNVVMR